MVTNHKMYIVVDGNNHPLELAQNPFNEEKDTNILIFGDSISMFTKHDDAYNAVRRTKNYVNRKRLAWGKDMRIVATKFIDPSKNPINLEMLPQNRKK